MCLIVKRVKKKPMRRVAWKVVQKDRAPLHQDRPARFYRKGRTVREDPRSIVVDLFGRIFFGLHVYTSLSKAMDELSIWRERGVLIKAQVSSKHWHADGIKGDAVYSQLKVLT